MKFSTQENTMKPSSLSALLACAAILAPFGAQAAMDDSTRATFTQECVSAAKQQNLDDKVAKAHCDCGARQVDAHFTPAEIASLNDSSKAPSQQLSSKMQKLVAENCVQPKN
jgi:hypothetical protein